MFINTFLSSYGLVVQINATTVTEVGNPKDKICEAVEKFKATLLVVGNNGRGALKRSVMHFFSEVYRKEKQNASDILIDSYVGKKKVRDTC